MIPPKLRERIEAEARQEHARAVMANAGEDPCALYFRRGAEALWAILEPHLEDLEFQLDNARGVVSDQMQTYSKVAGECVDQIDKTLAAYREALGEGE